jgi:hypothetical protein
MAGAGTVQGITIFVARQGASTFLERSALPCVSIKNVEATQSGGKRRIPLAT